MINWFRSKKSLLKEIEKHKLDVMMANDRADRYYREYRLAESQIESREIDRLCGLLDSYLYDLKQSETEVKHLKDLIQAKNLVIEKLSRGDSEIR